MGVFKDKIQGSTFLRSKEDVVIEILKAIGYDLEEYEGEFTFNGVRFLKHGMELGYDYLRLSEDLRDSLA